MRATNAQYDWAESLKCLDVRKLDLSPGDVGWDVYSLHYHVDGAISTVSGREVGGAGGVCEIQCAYVLGVFLFRVSNNEIVTTTTTTTTTATTTTAMCSIENIFL